MIEFTSTVPTLLWGPPGVGKTSVAYAYARRVKKPAIYLPLAERDPSEIAGAAYIDRNGEVTARWAPSSAWRDACNAPHVVILDELTAAPRLARIAALRYADYSSGLHAETVVIGTANPPEYAAGAGDPLTPPDLSRWRHVTMGPDMAIAWMLSQPGDVGRVGGYLHVNIEAALAKPEAMCSATEQQKPFPTPRGWTACAMSGLPVSDWSSIVGPAAVLGWVSWCERSDIPDPEDVLNGKSVPIPKRGDAVLATAASCVARCSRSASKDRVQALLTWLGEASQAHAGVIAHIAQQLSETHVEACVGAVKDGRWARLKDVVTAR